MRNYPIEDLLPDLAPAELSPHVTVLHYGRVIADGPPAEVRCDPQVLEIYLGA